MIDIDKYEEHYGMNYEELLETYSNLSVDDYKELLSEVKRLREGIEHALHIRLRHGQEEGWKELKEMIE